LNSQEVSFAIIKATDDAGVNSDFPMKGTITMIEPRINTRIQNALELAHKERAAAFAKLFRALPRLAASLRH